MAPPIEGAALAADTIEMFVVDGGYLGVVSQDTGELHLAGLVSGRREPVEFVREVARRFAPQKLNEVTHSRRSRSRAAHAIA